MFIDFPSNSNCFWDMLKTVEGVKDHFSHRVIGETNKDDTRMYPY